MQGWDACKAIAGNLQRRVHHLIFGFGSCPETGDPLKAATRRHLVRQVIRHELQHGPVPGIITMLGVKLEVLVFHVQVGQ